MDQNPGAEHVEGHQYADDRHPQAENQRNAADRLEQQVRLR